MHIQYLKVALLSILIVLHIGCQESRKKPVTQNDRLALVPEPDKALREEFELIEQLSKAINKDSILLINPTKSLLAKIDSLSKRKTWTAIDKRKIETDSGNAMAVYYFLKANLTKIQFLQRTKEADRFTEYYIEDDQLYFLADLITDSIKFNDIASYESKIDSFFLLEDKMLYIHSNISIAPPQRRAKLESSFETIRNKLLEP